MKSFRGRKGFVIMAQSLTEILFDLLSLPPSSLVLVVHGETSFRGRRKETRTTVARDTTETSTEREEERVPSGKPSQILWYASFFAFCDLWMIFVQFMSNNA